MKRRTFIATSTAAIAMVCKPKWAFALAADDSFVQSMGLQLWTVRNQMEQDATGTLKAIADAGYHQVELMRVLGDGKVVAQQAKDAGLKVTSAFIDWNAIANPDGTDVPDFKEILDAAKKLDLKYLVFGYVGKEFRKTSDQYKAMAERSNKAGELCKAAGIQLCYHNHSFEFEELSGKQTGFDVFCDEFDHDLAKFELDVFWAAIGGHDPNTTMKRLDGRIAQVHLKDLKANSGVIYDEGTVPKDAFKEVGSGTIDMKKVIATAHAIGVEQCHVEQDESPNPVKSAGQSMQYLTKLQ